MQRNGCSPVKGAFTTSIPFRSIGRIDHLVRRGLLGSLLGAGSTLPAGSASGDTLRVPSQFSTIQGAVDAAVDGDVVEIQAGI